MRTILFVAVILFTILFMAVIMFTAGCGDGDTPATTAPHVSATVVPSGAELMTIETEDGPTRAWVTKDKSSPNGVKILYICDGPLIGPQLEGHCAYDGSNCSGEPGAWEGGWAWVAAPAPNTSAPIVKGDGDGVVIR